MKIPNQITMTHKSPFPFDYVWFSVTCLAIALLGTGHIQAQPIPFKFSPDDYQKFTSLYQGDRFPDGRPLVSKDILERMKLVTVEEAWGILRSHGYNNQFEQDWVMTHENPVLVGRAVTIGFLPERPDISGVIAQEGADQGLPGRDKHWVMDKLQEDDVIVADLLGKKVGGAFIGDNLANMIHKRTGTGMVVDGGCRDLAGVLELENFYVFNRNWHPSTSQTYDKTMVISYNAPIHIGQATVMPGDVVLGLREGIMFVPAHLAVEVVETSEVIRLRDEFGFARLKSGTYTAGQIDSAWTDEIRDDFRGWLQQKNVKLSEFQTNYIDEL